MNAKCFHVALLIWIIGIMPIAFSETFQSRQAQAEWDEIVERGTECVRGVNERCWATQYQADPVAYQVAPFTNTAGFYLDQSQAGVEPPPDTSGAPDIPNTSICKGFFIGSKLAIVEWLFNYCTDE